MKNKFCLLFWMFHVGLFAQVEETSVEKPRYSFDVNNFYGSIINHNPDITHLISGKPRGIIASFQRKTFGTKAWQRLYNNPDYGVTFIYQDLDDNALGEGAGLVAHYNFYFLKRSLMLRLGQGGSYISKIYDEDHNFRNIAYGTHLVSTSFIQLQYKREAIFEGLGVQFGAGIVHYSNANFKAPNKSTNTLFINAGLSYVLDQEEFQYQKKSKEDRKEKAPFGYGLIFRSGINESDVVGSGQFPFYTFGGFIDKRLSKKSALQLGSEVFFSKALERYIDFRATGGFNDDTTGDEDSKRAGIFLGHELRINKVSILKQLGYYFYYPYDFEGQLYIRAGVQYYITKNVFSSLTVRSHGAKAEAMELSVGYRF